MQIGLGVFVLLIAIAAYWGYLRRHARQGIGQAAPGSSSRLAWRGGRQRERGWQRRPAQRDLGLTAACADIRYGAPALLFVPHRTGIARYRDATGAAVHGRRQIPFQSATANLCQERVKRRPVLGGLLNEYERAA